MRTSECTSRHFVRSAVACVLLAAAAATPASAGDDSPHADTAAERRACTPDVLRLCRTLIPDRRAITDCLLTNSSRLSPDCRAVMASRR